jgi:single-stranded DNA-binding protein
MEHTRNRITLRGHLTELPQFSHENHGRQFYRFTLEVYRLSGAVDLLPIVAPRHIIDCIDPTAGSMIYVEGQVRSHNVRSENGRHLMIFVFANTVEVQDGQPENCVYLEGPLCREPTYRRTPLGREICDVMLAVPRAFHRADYLPCILWGKIAQQVSRLHAGDNLYVEGRLQSRVYTKLTENGAVERTAYEISALTAQSMPEDDGNE